MKWGGLQDIFGYGYGNPTSFMKIMFRKILDIRKLGIVYGKIALRGILRNNDNGEWIYGLNDLL